MNIHVVQPGETIAMIANQYGVSETRLILDNELTDPDHLVPGQTIVILYPEQIHIVQEGDSLLSIANQYQVSVFQLLRNNAYLSERDCIYPGETIVIRYNNNKALLKTTGFTNPFIDRTILRKTLPFLTYLTIFGYQASTDATIIEVDDMDIIQLAYDYGVAPLMFLSTLTLEGVGNIETSYHILVNEELIDRQIENILEILHRKGFYGIFIALQYLSFENLMLYENYISKLYQRLNSEGFQVFISIAPFTISNINDLTFIEFDYSKLGQEVDYLTIINFTWGLNFGPPLPITSIRKINNFIEFITQLVSPEKLIIGVPAIGYDWELPYAIGISTAYSINLNFVIDLARDVNATIQFDEISKTPYFLYTDTRGDTSIQHIVWFIDARTIDEVIKLGLSYNITGNGIWNILIFYPQLWLVINSQYQIEKVSDL
jgi:spore germination protein